LNPCPERSHALFGLGDLQIGEDAKVPVRRRSRKSRISVPIHCLYPLDRWKPQVIARAFGGSAPDMSVCEAGTEKHPALHCVASRLANLSTVAKWAKYACSKLIGRYDCDAETPEHCRSGYRQADWPFSIAYAHYKDEHPRFAKNLCSLQGSGILTAFPPRPDCTADPASVSSSQNNAPSPSAVHTEESSIMTMLTCMCLACASGFCFAYMRKLRRQRRWIWAGTDGQQPAAAVTTTMPQPLARSGSLELADWR